MNERFQNVSGATVAFTDDGIVCHDSQKHRLFPYGGIDSIKVDFYWYVNDCWPYW